jgi:DNA gyrase subunit B
MSKGYGAESISILKGLEAVKKRPGMYVGDISSIDATHHLLYEVFDNSIDEALAGHATSVEVVLHADGSASVRDDGRGIPVDIHREEGISAAEVIFTTLHAGGKFDNDNYAFSGGLHGVGAACTNALSDWMDVEIKRDGAVWSARFEGGTTVKPVSKGRALKKGEGSGTLVRFKPSGTYLRELNFERETLLRRFREVAFLNGGVKIVFTDERLAEGEEAPFTETCLFQDGMADFVRHIVGESEAAVPVAAFSGTHEGVELEVAFTWMVEDRPEDVRAYTNNIPQRDGGQHVTGFRAAIGKTLMAYAERNKLLKRSNRMTAEDLREGLACALLVRVPDPAFSSQTKEKLISTEARVAVEAVLAPAFAQWLDTHPEESRLIVGRAQDAAEAREAAKKARELSRTKKVGKRVSSASLPEKLSDCSSKTAAARELFLVEGDSAGGSAKSGRDRETQAILPLRGKILNVERATVSKALKNNEIAAMIQTLGAGVGDKMDLSRLRYGKIVVMTDADVDGSHIATLILTFLFRQMRPLVDAGHLYLAVPPLYRVRRKNEEDIYVRTDRDLTGLFLDRALAQKALTADGSVLEGAGVRRALDGLIETGEHAAAAARLLRHPALADALMGQETLRPLFGTGPISAAKTKKILAQLSKVLGHTDPDGEWRFDIKGDAEGYALEAIRHEDGLDADYSLSRADLTSWQVVRVMDEYHATGFTGEELAIAGAPVWGPVSFLEALTAAGSKGASVSRYKGLGEMNPDELWETTMDPRTRTLHRVTIKDAEEASSTFSDLMADNVSARRALIEQMCAGGAVLDI